MDPFLFLPPDEADYEVHAPLFYNKEADPQQSLYVSVPRKHAPKTAVLWFHGGGLTGEGHDTPRDLYTGDFLIFDARYRLSPQFPAPTPLDDAAAALGWVFRHLSEYGGSPSNLFIGGISAGAYLAAIITMNPAFARKYGYETLRAAGLLLVSGQMTTHFQVKADLGYPGGSAPYPVIDELAPFAYCSADLPPILLITGQSGLEMPARTEENAFFAATCRSLGHPKCEHYILGGHEHGAVGPSSNHLLLKFIREVLP